ncbi:hypothetical protein HY469_01430 [Candidatus Roizmanbacteria bacterium]|nr:hypothetical protein [Candidatus Roizmanbacteria bacterium]
MVEHNEIIKAAPELMVVGGDVWSPAEEKMLSPEDVQLILIVASAASATDTSDTTTDNSGTRAYE